VGRVHDEQVNHGRGCQEWYNISYSEIQTIKSLILYRSQFDALYEPKITYTNNPYVSNGVPIYREPVEVVYLDLEKLIEKCKFKDNQNKMIKMLMRGYIFRDIAEKFGWTMDNVQNEFERICRRIKEQNDTDWVAYAETSGKVKIPKEAKYKKCFNCEQDLRVDNFWVRTDRGGDGYKGVCKRCINIIR
jgi:hypothetical protein